MKVTLNFEHPRGYPEEVQLDDGTKWKLEGECNLCGDCCKEFGVPPIYRGKDGKCVNLVEETLNGQPRTVCAIFWERPFICALYPRDPYDPLPARCGYRWKQINE